MALEELTLTTAEVFPSDSDDVSLDLLTPARKTYVTVQTLSAALEDTTFTQAGSYVGKDGVRDIVADVPSLTPEIVKEALRTLSKETKINYRLDL